MREQWISSNGDSVRRGFNDSVNDRINLPRKERSQQRKSRTTFLDSLKVSLLYYLRQVRLSVRKTSSTFDRFTLAETLLYSVLMTLISFATFWMFFIFVILNGSIAILMLFAAVLGKSGRKTLKFVRSIRNRSSE